MKILAALSMISVLATSAASYADQTFTLNYPSAIEISNWNSLDLAQELRNQGAGAAFDQGLIVKAVRLTAKSRFNDAQVALQIGFNRVATESVPAAGWNNYDSDDFFTFRTVDLINRELNAGSNPSVSLTASDYVKISRIEVLVGEKQVLNTRLVESFHLDIGQESREKMDVSLYGPIQSFTLAVQNRDVTITEFTVEDSWGRQTRLPELEGHYHQNRDRKFSLPFGQTQAYSKVIVRGMTEAPANGRATVLFYIESLN